MSFLTAIPTEIIENIIDHLRHDHNTLRATSLVSSSFLPRCQKHLFSVICVDLVLSRVVLERFRALYDIFSMSPHLALNVEDIYLVGYVTEGRTDHYEELSSVEIEIVPRLLQLFKRGRKVDITSLYQSRRGGHLRESWTNYPEALITAISELCNNPTVIDISISCVQDFPLSVLSRSPGLKRLSLRDLDFSVYNSQSVETDLEGVVPPQRQVHLDTLEMDRSFDKFFPMVAQAFRHPNSIVSMSQIRALKIVGPLPKAITGHPVWDELNRLAPTLECLMWNQATDWEGRTVISKFYAEPFNLVWMRNLRYLVLTFLADVNNYGIIPNLDWLSESLNCLRQRNQIEDITIILIYQSWNRDNTNALLSVWMKRLDAVICSPGFPVLKRIRIILPDFADRVRRFTIDIKPQLGLQVAECFQIVPLEDHNATIWKQTITKAWE